MRAASCSSQAWSGPGLPGDRLLACAVPDAGQRFRLSRPSAFPQAAGAPPSTLDFTATRISDPLKSPDSSVNCSSTCAATLFCSGIGDRPTREPRPESSCESTLACTPISFPAMPRNLTRMSSFGTTSNELWPTVRPKTCVTLSGSFIRRSSGCANPRSFFGRASTHPIFRGHDVSITYA